MTTTPLASHIDREGGRKGGIQKVALKSLKLAYVQVETPKFTRPCTLACNCKIIWVSDSGQVGEWSKKFHREGRKEGKDKMVL